MATGFSWTPPERSTRLARPLNQIVVGQQRPISRKRKRDRPADGSVRRHRAEYPHQVWARDFQCDAAADGRRLKFLNVIDEHSRLCLAIRVGRRCKAKDVVAVLEEQTSFYPAPTFIRSDNGPEFVAQALGDWCEVSDTTRTDYIEPRSQWENSFAESFNGRFRDEFLNTELFSAALEAQLLLIAGAGTKTRSAHIRPQGTHAPGSSSTRSCSMNRNTHSHKHWTGKGGHIRATTARPTSPKSLPKTAAPWGCGTIAPDLYAQNQRQGRESSRHSAGSEPTRCPSRTLRNATNGCIAIC